MNLSIYLSIYLCIYLSIYTYKYIYMEIKKYIYIDIYIKYIYIYTRLSYILTFFLAIYLSHIVTIYLAYFLTVYLTYKSDSLSNMYTLFLTRPPSCKKQYIFHFLAPAPTKIAEVSSQVSHWPPKSYGLQSKPGKYLPCTLHTNKNPNNKTISSLHYSLISSTN